MAFLFRPKGRGIFYIVDKSRKPSWIQLGKISHAEAKNCLRKYETDSTYLRLGLPLPPSKITLKELSEEYFQSIKGIKAPYTIEREEYRLNLFCKDYGETFISDLSARMVEEWLSKRAYKPRSWRDMTLSIRSMYKLAVSCKYLPENPILKVRLPKIGRSIPKFVDPKLLDKVISYMQGSIKVYFSILRYTGMRPGEAIALKVSNIREITYSDKKGKKAVKPIFLFKAPKTGIDRAIPIHPKLIKMIRELIIDRKPDDYLFPSSNGEHQKSMKMGLRRALDKSGIKGVSRYTFRHSVATDMLAKTGNLRAVQTVLGHSRSTTTEIYAYALEAAQMEAVDVL